MTLDAEGCRRSADYVPADVELQVARDLVEQRHGQARAKGAARSDDARAWEGVDVVFSVCNSISSVEASRRGGWGGVGRIWPRWFPEAVVAITGRRHGCMSRLGNGWAQEMRDALPGVEPAQVPSTDATGKRLVPSKRPVDGKVTVVFVERHSPIDTPDLPARRNAPRLMDGCL